MSKQPINGEYVHRSGVSRRAGAQLIRHGQARRQSTIAWATSCFISRQAYLHDGDTPPWTLESLHIGQTVKEVIDRDLQAEMAARALYEEAATHCHSVKDYVTRDLFEELMHDEEDHIDFLETQLDLVAKLGLELYAQHHIGKLDED